MIGFLIRVAIAAFGLWLSARYIPGIEVPKVENLLLVALILGVANAVVRPILVILTLPLTILTLGLFLLVINAAMIGLVAFFLHGFHVHDFIAALLCWVVVSLTSWVVGAVLGR